jgi:hypothetical protein
MNHVAKQQLTNQAPDTPPILPANGIKRTQQITGTLLCHARVVDGAMLVTFFAEIIHSLVADLHAQFIFQYFCINVEGSLVVLCPQSRRNKDSSGSSFETPFILSAFLLSTSSGSSMNPATLSSFRTLWT